MLHKKTLSFILFVLLSFSYGQVKFCSWNLQNFGKSKSDSTIQVISKTLKDFDLVAIVEVVAGNGGAQAVTRLVDALNREGSKWDYSISDPTFGLPNRSERYAFIWKTHKLKKIGEAWLDTNYKSEIEREPYLATFSEGGKEFTVAAFHALPKNKFPETEIKYLKFLPAKYPHKTILFCGDFNCPESNSVFTPLKLLSYPPIFTKQRTTLKNECLNEQCLASEYDNVFYNSTKIHFIKSGIIPFYKNHHLSKFLVHTPVYRLL